MNVRIEKEKENILAMLKNRPMTIREMASLLGVTDDTIRYRIRDMRIEKKPVCVSYWDVYETTMVRVYGYGKKDAPRPERSKVKNSKRPGKVKVVNIYPPIPYLMNHRLWDHAMQKVVRRAA